MIGVCQADPGREDFHRERSSKDKNAEVRPAIQGDQRVQPSWHRAPEENDKTMTT